MEKAAVLMEKDATYRLREEVTVRNLPEGDHRLDVWIPLPQNDANQQVLEVTVESDADLSLHFEREWGNAILFGRLPSARRFRAVLDYPVLRRAEPADIDPARARPLSGAPGPFLRSLTPERYVRVDEETREQVQGQEPCDVCGYHCWAEVYVAGLGWLPVDASCACKYGHAGFGTLDLNHVAFSRGRDLLLEPPQNGDRLLFFPSAYVEVDGAPCPGVERRLRFEPVGISD